MNARLKRWPMTRPFIEPKRLRRDYGTNSAVGTPRRASARCGKRQGRGQYQPGSPAKLARIRAGPSARRTLLARNAPEFAGGHARGAKDQTHDAGHRTQQCASRVRSTGNRPESVERGENTHGRLSDPAPSDLTTAVLNHANLWSLQALFEPGSVVTVEFPGVQVMKLRPAIVAQGAERGISDSDQPIQSATELPGV